LSPSPILSLVAFSALAFLIVIAWKIFKAPWFIQNVLHSKKELIEDILKQLFHVSQSEHKASINALAGALSMPSSKVIKLIHEMIDQQLVNTSGDWIELTESGQIEALRIIRVHRLWEKYLSERTGFNQKEWHDIAERKEHKMNRSEEKALSLALGNPRYDPHGDPIPTPSGEIIIPDWSPLPALTIGSTGRIVHIEDEPEVVYQQIISRKLHIGSQIRVNVVNDESIVFESEGLVHELSMIVASNINVAELTAQDMYEKDAVRLSSLLTGEMGKIIAISSECRGANRRRLLDLGFVTGSEVEVAYENPLKEPKAYLIRNTLVALRHEQSDFVIIEKAT
jgi:DtxR family Mn-dependent transcriptional regulator